MCKALSIEDNEQGWVALVRMGSQGEHIPEQPSVKSPHYRVRWLSLLELSLEVVSDDGSDTSGSRGVKRRLK